MGSSTVASVTKYFPQANEGFVTTLQTTIAPGATTVGLQGVAGLTNATVFVGIIEPGGSNQQVFTGTVDTVGSQITGVVWTRGNNVTHNAGVTIVDYTTGTALNMITTGILKFAAQNGNLVPAALYDVNGNKTIEFTTTASAVNNIQITQGIAGQLPGIHANGSDSNIGINFAPKGTDTAGGQGGLFYNGVSFRTQPRDWTQVLLPAVVAATATPTGTWSPTFGTGWTFPGNYANFITSSNTQNAEIRYKIYLDAGTYTFINYHSNGTGNGQVTWGWITEAGTVVTEAGFTELYAASGTNSVTTTTSGVNFAAGGYYTFFLKTPTKNASSTGYATPYFGTQIIRTA